MIKKNIPLHLLFACTIVLTFFSAQAHSISDQKVIITTVKSPGEKGLDNRFHYTVSKSCDRLSETYVPCNFIFFVCTNADLKDCKQLNNEPVTLVDIKRGMESSKQVKLGDFAWIIPGDSTWFSLLPDVRDFLKKYDQQFLDLLNDQTNVIIHWNHIGTQDRLMDPILYYGQEY